VPWVPMVRIVFGVLRVPIVLGVRKGAYRCEGVNWWDRGIRCERSTCAP